MQSLERYQDWTFTSTIQLLRAAARWLIWPLLSEFRVRVNWKVAWTLIVLLVGISVGLSYLEPAAIPYSITIILGTEVAYFFAGAWSCPWQASAASIGPRWMTTLLVALAMVNMVFIIEEVFRQFFL